MGKLKTEQRSIFIFPILRCWKPFKTGFLVYNQSLVAGDALDFFHRFQLVTVLRTAFAVAAATDFSAARPKITSAHDFDVKCFEY